LTQLMICAYQADKEDGETCRVSNKSEGMSFCSTENIYLFTYLFIV